MNKTLREAIIKLPKLRNKLLKDKTEESKRAYNCQRRYGVNLLRKTKKAFFCRLKYQNRL